MTEKKTRWQRSSPLNRLRHRKANSNIRSIRRRTTIHSQHSITGQHHCKVRREVSFLSSVSSNTSFSAKSHDLKTTLAGQIARAAAVFCVDEIIVFTDSHKERRAHQPQERYHERSSNDAYGFEAEDGYTGWSDPDHFLCHILSYLECPPHLRKRLFSVHPNLRTAGTLPSLDMPHHPRQDEWCEYREGVTVDTDPGHTTIDIGWRKPVVIYEEIPIDTRVSLKLPSQPPTRHHQIQHIQAVAPTAPREEAGYYWGYTVRPCDSLSAVFTECPFDGGYDVSIGTSERGRMLDSVLPEQLISSSRSGTAKNREKLQRLPDQFAHLLLVFGGVAGLEAAATADGELAGQGVTAESVSELFDAWVNICPGQGSRTIRTEEAVLLGLAAFKLYVAACGQEHFQKDSESEE